MRLRNDTWAQAEHVAVELSRSRAALIESVTEAALGFIRCYRCRKAVPARFGDLNGAPLGEAIIEAELVVARKHPAHDLIWVGEPPRAGEDDEEAAEDESTATRSSRSRKAGKTPPAAAKAVKFIEPEQVAR
jgi:hypothetical protein